MPDPKKIGHITILKNSRYNKPHLYNPLILT